MDRLLETRRYVVPEEILTLDSTALGDIGACELVVLSPLCGHSFSVSADLAEVGRLLRW